MTIPQRRKKLAGLFIPHVQEPIMHLVFLHLCTMHVFNMHILVPLSLSYTWIVQLHVVDADSHLKNSFLYF